MTFPEDYRRGRHVVSALHVHLVFVTKYRRGVLDAATLDACETTMRKVAVSAMVNSLKGVSARRLRSEFAGRVNRAIRHGHFWSPSYFAASCGGAPLSIIRQYIEQQRAPARATSGLTPP